MFEHEHTCYFKLQSTGNAFTFVSSKGCLYPSVRSVQQSNNFSEVVGFLEESSPAKMTDIYRYEEKDLDLFIFGQNKSSQTKHGLYFADKNNL